VVGTAEDRTPEQTAAGTLESSLDRAHTRSRTPVALSVVGAGLVHAALIAVALAQGDTRPPQRMRAPLPAIETEMIVDPPPTEPEPEAKPEPEPEKPPEPPKAEAVPPPALKPLKRVQAIEKAAPAAAQAAKVLTAEPKEVLDFGETFVQGNAASYAGGVTESGGTSAKAVRDTNARAYGMPGGTGTSAIDRSRDPSLAEGTRWDCPFPEEADDDGMDHGVVTLSITISASGSVDTVAVKADPGHGFGREARRCALRKRWQAGRDRAGNPIAATRLLNVRFDRQ
jgi:protein TonB